jgi:hypothetical protein
MWHHIVLLTDVVTSEENIASLFSPEVCSSRNSFGFTDVRRKADPGKRGEGVKKENWFEPVRRNWQKAALHQDHNGLSSHTVPRNIRSSSLTYVTYEGGGIIFLRNTVDCSPVASKNWMVVNNARGNVEGSGRALITGTARHLLRWIKEKHERIQWV